MNRKLLFLVFTNEACRRNHAFLYALDLHRHGHEVRIIVEGEATRCFAEREGFFGELFSEAQTAGLIAGACRTASGGCASQDPSRKVTDLIAESGVALLEDMRGHAGISAFVQEGYDVIVF